MGLFDNNFLNKLIMGKSLGTFITKGNGKTDLKVEIFYKDIDPALAHKYMNYFYEHFSKLQPGEGNYLTEALSSYKGVIIIRKQANEVELFDNDYQTKWAEMLPFLSEQIFDNQPVELILVDKKYNDKRRITGQEKAINLEEKQTVLGNKEEIATENKSTQFLNSGKEFQQAFQYEEAILHYTRALEIDANIGDAILNRAICYYHNNNFEKSIDAFNTLAKVYPGNTVQDICFWYLGMNFYKISHFKEAATHLQRAIELEMTAAKSTQWWQSHNLEDAYYTLGNSQFNLKLFREAIINLTKTLSFSDKYAIEVFTKRGISYCFNKNFEEAISDFTYLIKQKPEKLASIYTLRGLTYLYSNRYEKALSDSQKASALDQAPNPYSLALKSMTNYYLKKGTVEEIDDALKTFPNEGYLIYAKGRILLDMGEKEKAKVYLELADDMEIEEAKDLLFEL